MRRPWSVRLSHAKFGDAEPVLLQGYDGMKQRVAQIPPEARIRLRKVVEWIVSLYEAWGKPAKAAEWRKTLEQQK